jgi:hypothetical protein
MAGLGQVHQELQRVRQEVDELGERVQDRFEVGDRTLPGLTCNTEPVSL